MDLKAITDPGVRFLVFSDKPDSYQGLDKIAWEFAEIGKCVPATTATAHFDSLSDIPQRFLEWVQTAVAIATERAKRYSEEERAKLPPVIFIADDATPLVYQVNANGDTKTREAINAAVTSLLHVGRSANVFYLPIVHSFNADDILGIGSAASRKAGLDLVALGLETHRATNAVGATKVEGGYNGIEAALKFAGDYNSEAPARLKPLIPKLIAESKKSRRAVMILLSSTTQKIGLLRDYRPLLQKRGKTDWSRSGGVPRDRAFEKPETPEAADLVERVERAIAEDGANTRVVPITGRRRQAPVPPPPPPPTIDEEEFRKLFGNLEPDQAWERVKPHLEANQLGRAIREGLGCSSTKKDSTRNYKAVGWPAIKFLIERYDSQRQFSRYLGAGLSRPQVADGH